MPAGVLMSCPVIECDPHRHSTDPKDELLVAIRGRMALLTFDDAGDVTTIIGLSPCSTTSRSSTAVEIPPNTWHTVLALETGCILLEVKAGPFNPDMPKELAVWAPEEESSYASIYIKKLLNLIDINELAP